MGLFDGLEKLGLRGVKSMDNLFEDEKKKSAEKTKADGEDAIPEEKDFLLEKHAKCAVCDKTFTARLIKSGRAKRLESDPDLRPRYMYIDTVKYDIMSCPHCGYTAMPRYFDHLSSTQLRLIKEQICANFTSSGAEEPETIDYDTAIGRFKLGLYTAIVKRAKNSEKAYFCLKIAWLYRGKAESFDPKDPVAQKIIKNCREQEEAFYKQAYDGFTKAVSSEMFPICGMDQSTIDYLLAVMSRHFKRYDMASKCISNILSSNASAKVKDKARDLKDEIVAEIKSGK